MRSSTRFAALSLITVATLFGAACGSDGETLPAPVDGDDVAAEEVAADEAIAADYQDEQPAGSGNWVPIDAKPSWVSAPPPKDGTRRFVEQGRSNLHRIATHRRSPLASRFLTENVRVALEPLIGNEAATATADDVLEKLVMVHRACEEKSAPPVCTSWALWELPLDDAVATVPGEHRPAARELLATIDLTTRPEKYRR